MQKLTVFVAGQSEPLTLQGEVISLSYGPAQRYREYRNEKGQEIHVSEASFIAAIKEEVTA